MGLTFKFLGNKPEVLLDLNTSFLPSNFIVVKNWTSNLHYFVNRVTVWISSMTMRRPIRSDRYPYYEEVVDHDDPTVYPPTESGFSSRKHPTSVLLKDKSLWVDTSPHFLIRTTSRQRSHGLESVRHSSPMGNGTKGTMFRQGGHSLGVLERIFTE